MTIKSYCCVTAFLVCFIAVCRLEAQTSGRDTHLQSRVVHTDPSKYRDAPRVHGGAGTLSYTGLLGPEDFNVNLIFLHRGVLQPK